MHHVLLITENHPPDRGGMAESCDRIVRGLRREGVSVDVVHFDRKAVRPSYRGNHLRWPLSSDAAHTINGLWNHMRQLLDLGRTTHVVAFGGTLPVMAAPAFAAWLRRPLVTLLRGNELDAGLFDPRRRPLLDDAIRRSALVGTVTTEQADKVRGLYDANVRVIANGIDFDLWRPTQSDRERAAAFRAEHVPTDRLVLGFFGHLKAKKGVPFFLDVLRRGGDAERFHVLMIGEADAELQAFLDEHPELSRTQLPSVDRYELLPYHLAADYVVLPSHYDGFPNVLIEAMALGRPLLASNVGGMRDVLIDGENAFLFPPGDEHECRRAIHRAAQAPATLREALGRRAEATAHEQCNARDEARHYLAVLDAITREEIPCVTSSSPSPQWP
ncbi:MAG TPA: glycosyltransferase family 4 protein [Thermoanaerobaculia bacterium]